MTRLREGKGERNKENRDLDGWMILEGRERLRTDCGLSLK